MNLNEIVFIDNLPTLDLHGYDRVTATVLIDDFIKYNIKMQNEFLVIVHGIGDGILRKTTHLFLAKNPKIKQYKLCSFNVGCTLVHVDLTK